MQLNGKFQITDWQEAIDKTFENEEKLTHANVTQQYSGDLMGTSEVTFQMNYAANGNASFVGFEYFDGEVANEPCKLILKHDGKFESGVAKSQFTIIASTTNQALIGLHGHFESTEGGQANYTIG